MCSFARLLLLATIWAVASCASAFAQGSAAIDPPILHRTAAPGETITADLRVSNPERVPLAVTVYPQDWSFDPDGDVAFDPAGTLTRSAAEWIDFSPSTATLNPGEATTIEYDVRVPADVEPGSYWAVLFVEGQPEGTEAGGAGFRVRLGHVVYIDVPPLDPNGSVRAIFGERTMEGSSPAWEFNILYANTGNSVQELDGFVEVRPLDGGNDLRVPINTVRVLPESERLVTRRLLGPLDAGEYLALVVLNYGDPDVDVAGETVFTLDEELPNPRAGAASPEEATDDEGNEDTP